jgi:hypothetical protein
VKRLTDPFVAQLQMPEGKSDHYEWDADRELAVRLRKRGPKSKLSRKWYKGGQVGGRWKPILIGDCRQIKAETAYGTAHHISAQIATGEGPTAKRKKARDDAKARTRTQKLQLGAVIPRYLAKKEKEVKRGTFAEAKRYLEKTWSSLHNRPIDPMVENGIKRADVALVLEGIEGLPSAGAARSSFNGFYAWAGGAGLCEVNPVTGTVVKSTEARSRVLSLAEIKAIWAACEELGAFGSLVRLCCC